MSTVSTVFTSPGTVATALRFTLRKAHSCRQVQGQGPGNPNCTGSSNPGAHEPSIHLLVGPQDLSQATRSCQISHSWVSETQQPPHGGLLMVTLLSWESTLSSLYAVEENCSCCTGVKSIFVVEHCAALSHNHELDR